MSGHMLNSQLTRCASRSSGTHSTHHSSRIEKPRSHHNSPRTLERRKTTTENKLYATLDDHFRMMFGISSEDAPEDRPQPSRPMSWHPSSSQLQASRSTHCFEPVPQHSWLHQSSPSSTHSNQGSDFYSLSTRNSMYEPTPNAQDYTTAYGMQRGSGQFNQPPHRHTSSYAHSSSNMPISEPLPWYLQQWAQKNQAQAMMNPSSRSTDFLPIQGQTGRDEEMEEDQGERLVALGLYDVPEPSPVWNSANGSMGKGLKLEETWQPPSNEDEEEEDDDADADDTSSEASVEEPSPPLSSTHHPSQYMPLPVHVKSQSSGIMEGQSFFFDGDETVSKEWWFQQLKQPTLAGRDAAAGLGYGWL